MISSVRSSASCCRRRSLAFCCWRYSSRRRLRSPAFRIAAYIYHRNSPAVKERRSREATEELYRLASAIEPPDLDRDLDRMMARLDARAMPVAIELYKLEGINAPPPVPPICNSIEGARYRDKLHAYIAGNYDRSKAESFLDALIYCLWEEPTGEGIFEGTSYLSNKEIEDLIVGFYDYPDHFRELKKVFDRNLHEQKGVMPSAYEGENCAFAYLKDTPLLDLEKRVTRVGLAARTEHTQIVAGSGSGKTSLIDYMIHHDLDPDSDCCVVVIDSQRQLIDKLARRDLPTSDVAYFSPHHRLGINIFDVEAQGEEEVIAVSDLMEYVLSGLIGAELTPKQATLFNNAVQLLTLVPGANLTSFRALLRKNGLEPFLAHVPLLPEVARDFFVHEFGQQGYGSTKDEILWRLDAMQRNPAFARIFGATKNPIDMAREMRDRKLVLIDTDVNYLGDRGSSFFGRFFLALILKAARQRFSGRHRPVYLYIDECAAYLDSRLELMLQQARKANIGVILAHQDLEKARSAGILATILGNTATKFAGRLSDGDARVMAANMAAPLELLKGLPRYHFAMSAIGSPTVAIRADTRVLDDVDERIDLDLLKEEMERRYWRRAPKPAEPSPEPTSESAAAPAEPKPAEPSKAPPPPPTDEEIAPSATL